MPLTFYRDYSELFSGCLAYYDCSVSGSTLLDVMGSYNATITGSPPNTTDIFGKSKAFQFTYASTPTHYINTGIVPEGWTSGTIIAVVKIPVVLAANGGVIFAYGSSTNPLVGFSSYTGNPINFRVRNAAGNIEAAVALTGVNDNTWRCVTGSWNNAGSAKIYSNGVLGSSMSGVGAYPSSMGSKPFYIGTTDSAQLECNLAIGDVMIFNVQKSDAEVYALSKLLMMKHLTPVLSGVRGVE